MAMPNELPRTVSPALATTAYVSGAMCLLGAGLAVLACVQAPPRGSPFDRPLANFPTFQVVTQVMAGIALLRMPGLLNAQRKKLWEEKETADASGEELKPSDPALLDAAIPDFAWLLLIFGMLSVLPAVSLYLGGGYVIGSIPLVLFCPAAIVTGIVAISRGERGGIAGILFGVAGIALWVWVLVNLR
jgi:hypothetical protein